LNIKWISDPKWRAKQAIETLFGRVFVVGLKIIGATTTPPNSLTPLANPDLSTPRATADLPLKARWKARCDGKTRENQGGENSSPHLFPG
jgi:hypothetical protein